WKDTEGEQSPPTSTFARRNTPHFHPPRGLRRAARRATAISLPQSPGRRSQAAAKRSTVARPCSSARAGSPGRSWAATTPRAPRRRRRAPRRARPAGAARRGGARPPRSSRPSSITIAARAAATTTTTATARATTTTMRAGTTMKSRTRTRPRSTGQTGARASWTSTKRVWAACASCPSRGLGPRSCTTRPRGWASAARRRPRWCRWWWGRGRSVLRERTAGRGSGHGGGHGCGISRGHLSRDIGPAREGPLGSDGWRSGTLLGGPGDNGW
ncbi:hypothetical protein GGR56DRAFT_694544, partial [Xylariaceae sp. FL0804]